MTSGTVSGMAVFYPVNEVALLSLFDVDLWADNKRACEEGDLINVPESPADACHSCLSLVFFFRGKCGGQKFATLELDVERLYMHIFFGPLRFRNSPNSAINDKQ